MPATAATFCVNSAASFQSALTTSQGNGQTNEIKVVAGGYALATGLVYTTNDANTLFVRGSYAAGCATLSTSRSVLSGQGTVRPLRLFAPNANVSVEGFDFLAGLSTNNRGGGLSINAVDVRVDLNRFVGNRANDFAGGLSASSSGELRVRNNVFFENTANFIGGAELTCNGAGGFVTSNTIVSNTSDGVPAAGGIRIGGSAHFSLANNIVWDNTANGAVDLLAATTHLRSHNDIGTTSGTAPDAASSGNVSIDPDFAPCVGPLCYSFVLARSSPLVDAGDNVPLAGLTFVDLLGGARVVRNVVDIGAYELDRLFANGFQ